MLIRSKLSLFRSEGMFETCCCYGSMAKVKAMLQVEYVSMFEKVGVSEEISSYSCVGRNVL